jgi:hypothetical protein
MAKKPLRDLPPDWFCENQTDLLDLVSDMADALKEENDDADADPDRV